jgi:metacaspase-1
MHGAYPRPAPSVKARWAPGPLLTGASRDATVATGGMEGRHERIRALLVGVDRYERPEVPVLRGCVNDVVLVRSVLKRFFDVPNEDIRLVVNERATKAQIMRRLHAIIDASRAGDVVVFYFSGHGSQIRDRDGDELSDALDEVICPYDIDWDRRTYIVDDEIEDVFARLPRGVLLEAFFDCCFWGAGPRALHAEPRPQAQRDDLRWLPPPVDIAARAEGDEDRLAYHGLADCSCFADRNVYWGATAEGQAAAEDSFEGRPHGIFTYWGCRFIADNVEAVGRGGYSRADLLDELRAYLISIGYPQTPELAARDELRSGSPFHGDVRGGAWVEAGGGLRHRRPWRAPGPNQGA